MLPLLDKSAFYHHHRCQHHHHYHHHQVPLHDHLARPVLQLLPFPPSLFPLLILHQDLPFLLALGRLSFVFAYHEVIFDK